MGNTKYDVEFHFGVRPISQFDLYVTALFLSLAVRLIGRFTKTSPADLWAIIDEIGQHYHIRLINELILRVPELLSARIDRDVSKAIEEYKDMVEWEEPEIVPVFTEEKEGETPLGGEMRLRAPWIKDTKGI